MNEFPNVFFTSTMDEGMFTFLLTSRHAPVSAADCFDVLQHRGVNPAFALAQFTIESDCGTEGRGALNHNWGNLRKGKRASGYRGGFAVYDHFLLSLMDYCDLVHAYVELDGIKNIPEFCQRYAPSIENQTNLYINFVQSFIYNHSNLYPGSVIATWPSFGP
jgi:hypothetical protein